jgi:hypothetical protein
MPEDPAAEKVQETGSRGQEAPMVITPSALVRLIKQTAEAIRERRARRR